MENATVQCADVIFLGKTADHTKSYISTFQGSWHQKDSGADDFVSAKVNAKKIPWLFEVTTSEKWVLI